MYNDDDDNTPFIPDSTLSEADYLAKYNHMVLGGKLTQEYLKLRWQWMKGMVAFTEVTKAYLKTNAYQEHWVKSKEYHHG